MRFLLVVLFALSIAPFAVSQDSDHDGLSDELEQSLLAKFRPTFMTSPTDCATRPARFKAGEATPTPLAADGTIYGQVFPAADHRIEVHYYTLWSKDCGRVSHPLDVEHVSALVSNDGNEFKALYWYAGAHERTACDISSGTRAQAINASTTGPVIWSASGKHALYFKKEMCNHGCGADSCEDNTTLASLEPVINLGEPKAPANGSAFAASPLWPLSAKMTSDFPAAVLAFIESTPADAVSTLRGTSTVRGTIQGSAIVYDNISQGAATGAQHTEAALDTANSHTTSSLGKAKKATGNALTRAWRAVIHPKKDQPPPEPEKK